VIRKEGSEELQFDTSRPDGEQTVDAESVAAE
jgi:hypothetical protein